MSEDVSAQVVEKKKSPRRLVQVLVTFVLVAGAGVAGTLIGVKFLSRPAAAQQPAPQQAESEPEGPISVMPLEPVVVDVRGKDEDDIRHLKVGLSLEFGVKVPAEEIKSRIPRARQATITYLRARDFASLTDPKRFATVSKEIGDTVTEAMGKDRVSRVVLTDYVAQ